MLDALDASHVRHLGYERETTPTLDALAAEGVTFTQAFAPAPYTMASIASLMTGKLPDVHGVLQGRDALSSDEHTLAEAFAARGWRTLGATSNPNGATVRGADQGFDSFLELYRAPGAQERAGVKAEREQELRALIKRDQVHLVEAGEFPPVVEDWLNAEPEPATLYYLHILEPHGPYHPPREYRDRFVDPAYDGLFAGDGPAATKAAIEGGSDVADRDRAAYLDLYDASLAYGDAMLGEVLETYRVAGMYDELLIVVTSDHGEAFWQHGLWGHNVQLYDESLHVPLIVKFPTSWERPTGRESALVSTLDIWPSLAEWIDLPAPRQRLDGRSLERVLAPNETEFPERNLLARTHHQRADYALRTPLAKLIQYRDGKSAFGFGPRDERVELFDLVQDPSELRPLDPVEVGRQGARMQQILGARIREALSRAPGQPGQNGAQRGISEAEIELLRKLGYL